MESLKKHLITHLASITQVEGMENNEIILVTATGTITGSLAKVADDASDSVEILIKTTQHLISSYRENNNIPSDSTLDGNDGCILLKNARVQTDHGTLTYAFLCVFFDQIIGISVGCAEYK